MMTYRTLLLFVSGFVLGLGPSIGSAIDMSTEPPPANEVILGVAVEADLGCYLCSHGTAVDVELGQTFNLKNPGILSAITLKARALTVETPGEFVTLTVGTFSDTADATMEELLAIESWELPIDLPVEEATYLTFDLPDMYLESEVQYGFQLAFSGGGHVKEARLELLHVGSDAYSDGLAIEIAGAITTPLPYDLVFFLLGPPPIFTDGFETGGTEYWSVTSD